MKQLRDILLEKLIINKDSKEDSDELDEILNDIPHIMRKLGWYDGEYDIEKKEPYIVIKFKIKPVKKDFDNTIYEIMTELKKKFKGFQVHRILEDDRTILISKIS